jgi:hypothetical protein
MSRGSTWTNSDGLVVGFGTHSEDNNVAGVYTGANGEVTIVQEITLADLPDTFAATNVDPQAVRIPRGSVIKSAFLQTIVAASTSGSPTLDIGTWGVGLATEVVDDADGIVADATPAELGAIGEGILLDGPMIADAATAASTVATVGATSDSDCVIAASYETAAFLSGKVKLHLTYIPPSGSSGRTLAA